MLPDFNRLRVFYFIYARQSIVAAARELNLTQSAVSQHLRKLESEIKTILFTRLHKRLVPTMAAERLFAIVEPFVSELTRGVQTIRQAQEKPQGLLRFGAPVEFGKAYVPGICASFRRRYPEVVFSLRLGDLATLLPMVADGRLDFAYVDMFSASGQTYGNLGLFAVEPIIEEEVILACSREYYERRMTSGRSFEELVRKDFISYQDEAVALKAWFRHHFHRIPTSLNIVLTVDSLQAVMTSIRSHMGLGVIASHLASDDIRRGDMTPVSTSRKEVINPISLVQLLDKVPTLTEKTFQAHFLNEIHETGLLKNFSRISDAESRRTF